ncbi:MAG: sulfatase-like hydrolase/transferase, partial [Thermoplasmata archaeon]
MAVVILDTLRADMMDREDLLARLPMMQRLFRESYVFTRAYAPSHWSLPSHASLFTGLAPSEHMAYPPHMKLRQDVTTIAEVFRSQGYMTACITCNPFISDLFGMTRGFEVVWEPPSLSMAWRLGLAIDLISSRFNHNGEIPGASHLAKLIAAIILSTPIADNGARAATRCVGRMLRGNGSKTFLVVNLMEAHGPYHGRGRYAAWWKRIQYRGVFGRWNRLKFAIMGGRLAMTDGMRRDIDGIYWQNVTYMDSQLGTLVQGLPEDFLDKGYLVVLSDHGQLLGEDGGVDHSAGLGENLIRVPLVIRPPGGVRGQRMDRPIDITWVYSLLSSIASNEPCALADWLEWTSQQDSVLSVAHGGQVPYVDGLRERDPLFRGDLIAFKVKHDHPAIASIAGRWKLVCHLG